ncbi:MAG: sialate O-acetylesterase, partial [Verrucomicrobiota bacterium]
MKHRFKPQHTSLLAGLTLLLASPFFARAEVKPNRLFGHHMVLQQDLAVPVWGDADPGEKITVNFKGQTKKTTADKEGKWTLKLDPMKVSEPGSFTVNEQTFTNVVVGEVWLGSGQSNMAGSAGNYAGRD